MAKKAENKSFVLRVDAETMEALERWADDEFRSINGQLQWIIADALRRSGRLKKSKKKASEAERERSKIMGEFNKKWFQAVWGCMLLASVIINRIPRWSDAAWAHGAAIETINTVLLWITLPLTIIMFIALCINYWRQGERLFWRMWRRWGGALAVGIILAAVLVLLVRYFKDGSATIDENERRILVGIFAGAGLIWAVARYKFQNWHKKE